MAKSEDPDVREEILAWAARQMLERMESLSRAGLDRIPTEYRPALTLDPTKKTRAIQQPMADRSSETPLQSTTNPASHLESKPLPPRGLFEDQPAPGPGLSREDRLGSLATLREEVASCVRCALLAQARTQTVFGEGNPESRLMFIGEAPGADEDASGRPFVGRAGQLLTDIITKGMGIPREDVYIANVLKCRPPNNRDPEADEIANCRGYLDRQIEIIRPEFICLVGRIAAQAMLETALPLSKLRGKWWKVKGIPAIVIYHPAYLLRNPAAKKDVWEDIKILMHAMGIPIPSRRSD
jgi:DNA polymerase